MLKFPTWFFLFLALSGNHAYGGAVGVNNSDTAQELLKEMRELKVQVHELMLKQVKANVLLSLKVQLASEIDEIRLLLQQNSNSITTEIETIKDNQNLLDEIEGNSNAVHSDEERATRPFRKEKAQKNIEMHQEALSEFREKQKLLEGNLADKENRYKQAVAGLNEVLGSIGLTYVGAEDR